MPPGFEAPPPAGKFEGMDWGGGGNNTTLSGLVAFSTLSPRVARCAILGISDAIPLGLGKFHREEGDATPFGVGVLVAAVTRGSARCATPG